MKTPCCGEALMQSLWTRFSISTSHRIPRASCMAQTPQGVDFGEIRWQRSVIPSSSSMEECVIRRVLREVRVEAR